MASIRVFLIIDEIVFDIPPKCKIYCGKNKSSFGRLPHEKWPETVPSSAEEEKDMPGLNPDYSTFYSHETRVNSNWWKKYCLTLDVKRDCGRKYKICKD